jgi:hypothetical protein
MATKSKQTKRTNKTANVSKVPTNVETTPPVKQLTEAEVKEARAKKRALNPQYSHVVSRFKKDLEKFAKHDVKSSLVEGKKWSNGLLKVGDLSVYENEKQLNAGNKFINYVTSAKGWDLLGEDVSLAIGRNKKTGAIGYFKGLQLAQKVVKLIADKKASDYASALGWIIADRKKKAEK